MRLRSLTLPIACIALALTTAPAHADIVNDDSGEQTDSGDEEDEDDDDDKDGCSAVPITPTSALGVGVGLAMLAVVRRRKR